MKTWHSDVGSMLVAHVSIFFDCDGTTDKCVVFPTRRQVIIPPLRPLPPLRFHVGSDSALCKRQTNSNSTFTGPDHPLMRAVGGNPPEEASIEVLNFVLPSSGANAGEGADGGDGRVDAEGKGGGGCTSGYGNDFHESRSAVVFRKWFTEEQQQVRTHVQEV